MNLMTYKIAFIDFLTLTQVLALPEVERIQYEHTFFLILALKGKLLIF